MYLYKEILYSFHVVSSFFMPLNVLSSRTFFPHHVDGISIIISIMFGYLIKTINNLKCLFKNLQTYRVL